MSAENVLYLMLGVVGYPYRTIKMTAAGVEIHLECPKKQCKCCVCGSRHITLKGKKKRRWRTLSMGCQAAWIVMDVPRVRCNACQCVRQVAVDFADPHRRCTKRFEQYVLTLLCFATCKDVAKHLSLSWDTVRDIEKTSLQREFACPPLKGVRRIAIDEIAVKKRHNYLTIVMCLDSGRVIFVGDGRDRKALKPFWRRLKQSRVKIEAVATDMSPAYRAAIRKNLPDAVHVHDRFHIVKQFNEQLTKLRRRLQNAAVGRPAKDALKGLRFVLLKRRENLDEAFDEPARLASALDVSADLAVAYALKETLDDLWEAEDEDAAKHVLALWLHDADWSGIPEMQSFAKTLRRHWFEILNYHTFPLTTGPLEGLNNKIKTLKRQSYGFRDLEYFKLKIQSLHRTRYALVG